MAVSSLALETLLFICFWGPTVVYILDGLAEPMGEVLGAALALTFIIILRIF